MSEIDKTRRSILIPLFLLTVIAICVAGLLHLPTHKVNAARFSATVIAEIENPGPSLWIAKIKNGKGQVAKGAFLEKVSLGQRVECVRCAGDVLCDSHISD